MEKEMTAQNAIITSLKKAGIDAEINAPLNLVKLTLRNNAKPLSARKVLYSALNQLEPFFTVSLAGLPFCFMADAWDHIYYIKKRGICYCRASFCSSCRLTTICPGLEKSAIFNRQLRRNLTPVLKAPNEIVFELTNRCNLKCGVCCSSKNHTQECSLNDKILVLEQAKRMGVRNIRFTGGEPFLSKQFLPLLKRAKSMGFYTLVNTNALGAGTFKLKESAAYIDNILISLQGYDSQTEETATGVAGLFKRKIININLLRRYGIQTLRLGTIISKQLIREFDIFAELAKKLQPAIWELYRPMLTREQLRAEKNYRVTAADLRKLSQLIHRRTGPAKPIRIVIANPVPLCLIPEKERINFLGSAFDDGRTRLVYDAAGYFKPSYNIRENLGTDLNQAWNCTSLKKIFLSGLKRSACNKCDCRLKCLGGSRYLAKTLNGNFQAHDPLLFN